MRYFICLFMLLGLASCYQPERNCKQFQTGTFEYYVVLQGDTIATKMIRNDSIAIEYLPEGNDTSSVRWVNACECVVTHLNPETNAESIPEVVRILTTSGNTFTFEYKESVDSNRSVRGTAKKLD